MKIFLIFILLTSYLSCGKTSPGPGLERRQDEITQNEYLEILNRHRQNLGLKPLIYSYLIETVALGHSSNMAEGSTPFGHSGWKNRCQNIRDDLGGGACAEIVAMGQKSSQAVFDSWYNSPSHRATLEDPRFTHTGLGYVKNGKGVIYWTQLFLQVQ